MKRFRILLAVLLCCGALAFPVCARSSAEQLRSEITVSASGSCTVRIRALIHGDGGENPAFPLPSGAADVTLNGNPIGILEDQVPLGTVSGDYSAAITYTLPNAVTVDKEGNMLLTLPLLSGFAYPVDQLEFQIDLPADCPGRPSFTSGYHSSSIESLLDVTVSGSSIVGVSNTPLKDHETLVMTLDVNESLFPRPAAAARVLGFTDIAVIAVTVLAILYYIIALRPALSKRVLRSTPPDGICAGDLGLWFTGSGIDLSLLVVTWAQLGYLRIQLDENGRVLLHKRMDMGNERSAFENRCYKNLFGRRSLVEGTGSHYARLCRDVAKSKPYLKAVYRSGFGSVTVFRGLCALSAALTGFHAGGALAPQSVLLQAAMAVAAAALALGIQWGGSCVPGRNKLPLYGGGVCAGIWLALGILSGEWIAAAGMVLFQFCAGIAAAYGGRRTVPGQQAMAQILGLRKHMRSVSKKELQRLLKGNPGYFHELAPYALALNADRSFARRFARLRLPECTYLIGTVSGAMTAAEWAELLRTAVGKLDAKAKRLPLDKLLGR